ncbi:MAG: ATP-binding domain-containing protein, partial [Prevotella sp.]
ILFNATLIRNIISRDQLTEFPQISFSGFADIHMIPGDELIETLSTSYHDVGIDETIVITRSNKRANIYNQGIRNTVLGREEELTTGDMLMIVKNNYFWLQKSLETARQNNASLCDATQQDQNYTAHQSSNPKDVLFLANGDRAQVQRVRNVRTLYGFHFADAWLQFPDGQHDDLEATLLLDSLSTEAPALTKEQNQQLFEQVLADYADVPLKRDRMAKLREDRMFNAIQVKYAYAITCHKAQGGQWAHVYLDQGYMTDEMLTPDYIHWLYTAFTRATEQLYLINWPKNQTV